MAGEKVYAREHFLIEKCYFNDFNSLIYPTYLFLY
jgi:hypothetical protein